ncbi:MAG: hypothetical protein EOP06_04855 [Proteobacteria bacterium]|nr:MAG: hypothetical protein EOP06_04855 [Pseudomonadota bacterium]
MRHVCVVGAVLCLATAGCKTDFEKTADKSGEAVTVSSSELGAAVEVRVVPAEEPEKYFVYFGWPRIEAGKKLRIRTDRQLTLADQHQVSFSHKADHDQNLTYYFEILDEANRVERSFSKLVLIPRDWVVREGSNSLSQDQRIKIQRLFLSSTPLVTNGFNIEIVTDEIRSEDGLVETFQEHSKASFDQSGKGGGQLLIKARVAVGSLTIHMRGQQGGDGSRGLELPRASTGADAVKGGEYACSAATASAPMCYCKSYGPNAESGAAGGVGTQGSPAGKGGATGYLRLEIVDGKELGLIVNKLPGPPGSPGEGGPGQLGGFGGKGRGRSRSDCRGSDGEIGQSGPSGPVGQAALVGDEEQACVYIASEARNECL